MANRREDRYATAAEAAKALRTVGGYERSCPDAGRPDPAVDVAPRGLGSNKSESPTYCEPWSTRSTMIRPAVATGGWLSLLTRQSNWSPWVVLLFKSVALLVTFLAGFLFHKRLTDACDA